MRLTNEGTLKDNPFNASGVHLAPALIKSLTSSSRLVELYAC
jgi:hypothetical protein